MVNKLKARLIFVFVLAFCLGWLAYIVVDLSQDRHDYIDNLPANGIDDGVMIGVSLE